MLSSHNFSTMFFRDFRSVILRKNAAMFAHTFFEAVKSNKIVKIHLRLENPFKLTTFKVWSKLLVIF